MCIHICRGARLEGAVGGERGEVAQKRYAWSFLPLSAKCMRACACAWGWGKGGLTVRSVYMLSALPYVCMARFSESAVMLPFPCDAVACYVCLFVRVPVASWFRGDEAPSGRDESVRQSRERRTAHASPRKSTGIESHTRASKHAGRILKVQPKKKKQGA